MNQTFFDSISRKITNWNANSIKDLDFKAIASFCSLGFMLDDDTFSKK